MGTTCMCVLLSVQVEARLTSPLFLDPLATSSMSPPVGLYTLWPLACKPETS
jgi:hypothetical protein